MRWIPTFEWRAGALLMALVMIASLLLPGGEAAAQPEGGEEDPIDEISTLIEELNAGLTAAGSDCDAAANVIAAWLEAHGDGLQALNAEVEAALAEADAETLGDFEARIKPFFETMMGLGMQHCAGHEVFQEAAMAMDEVMGGEEEAPHEGSGGE